MWNSPVVSIDYGNIKYEIGTGNSLDSSLRLYIRLWPTVD